MHAIFTLLSLAVLLHQGSTTTANNSSIPKNIGFVLFPSFQALDVFGPLDALNLLSWQYQLNLTLISSTINSVSTKARSTAMNPYNSTFGESILPTRTFENAPPLDVLFIAVDINSSVTFVQQRYPQLQYLVTIYTKASIAASAGSFGWLERDDE